MDRRAETVAHCVAFIAENSDRGVHRAAHSIEAPPLAALGEAPRVTVRRLTTTMSIAGSSFDLWAALARLDVLLSDFRRIAPRFSFEQLAGQASVAAGNEYRHENTDPAHLARIEAACRQLTGGTVEGTLGGVRTMDVRVRRAGPWGGETGELVIEALRNHAVAGAASLWVLAHGEGTDERLPIRIDICEIARWAWEPDRLAAGDGDTGGHVVDWPYFLERLAQALGALPMADASDESFQAVIAPEALAADARLRDAVRVHPALAPCVDRLSCIR